MSSTTTPVLSGFLADHDARWLAEDVVLHDRTRAHPSLGRVAAATWWRQLFREAFADARADPTRITVDGPRVAVEWRFQGCHVGSLLGENPTGRHVSLPMVGIFEIEDGEIQRVDLYYDSSALLRAPEVQPEEADVPMSGLKEHVR